MKIVHRADASRSTGAGHVMRTLTLAAAAVERGHTVELHAKTLPPVLVERSHRLGVRIVEVTADGWSEEALAVLGAGADVICLDGYDYARELVDALSATPGLLMAIDDNREMPLDGVDVILNQNPHASPDMYRELRPRQLLLGPRFALVRDEVTGLRARRGVPSSPTRIVVSMGGTDPAELTLPSLQTLIDETDLEIDVTLGLDNANADSCRAFVAEHGHRINEVEPEDLPTALAGGDLALLAAGGTLWEAAALGVPTVALVVADNQFASASAAADQGVLILHDARNGFIRAAVARAVTTLASDRERRRQMARAGRVMIDGKGRTRVVRAMEALTRSVQRERTVQPGDRTPIRLRALVAEDKARLLRWRNQPEIAAQMFTDHAITTAEHERWFERAMKESPHAVYRIVEAGQDPIGFVSLTDIQGDTCTWAGYIGELEWQGRGAGTAAIWLSLELAFSQLHLEHVLLEVIATNRRAADVYARFGFEERKDFRKVVMKSGSYSEVNGLVLSRERWAATRPPVHHVLKQRGLIR